MRSSRRLPVSARKTDVLRMARTTVSLPAVIQIPKRYFDVAFSDVSTQVKAGLEVVLVSLFVQMPHGVLRPS